MKGIFSDSEEWVFSISGDWRDKEGNVVKYDEKSGKRIIISGGLGFFYFLKGDFLKAISLWKCELDVIDKLEREEKRRLHKGWFYYQIGISYHYLDEDKKSKKYLLLAKQEDKLSYGNKATSFPAENV